MTAPRWLRRLLSALRSLWERPDPIAALDSIQHQQRTALEAVNVEYEAPHPRLRAHLRRGDRLLRKAVDMLEEGADAEPGKVERLVRDIDHHLLRGRTL